MTRRFKTISAGIAAIEAHLLDGQPSHPSHSGWRISMPLLTQPKFGRLLAGSPATTPACLTAQPNIKVLASLSHRLAQVRKRCRRLRADIPADLLAATPADAEPQTIGSKDGPAPMAAFGVFLPGGC